MKTIQRDERKRIEFVCEEPGRGSVRRGSEKSDFEELNAARAKESGGFGEPKGVKREARRGLNIRV